MRHSHSGARLHLRFFILTVFTEDGINAIPDIYDEPATVANRLGCYRTVQLNDAQREPGFVLDGCSRLSSSHSHRITVGRFNFNENPLRFVFDGQQNLFLAHNVVLL